MVSRHLEMMLRDHVMVAGILRRFASDRGRIAWEARMLARDPLRFSTDPLMIG
jgi:hypothetical protein